jgi:hypothetical protein
MAGHEQQLVRLDETMVMPLLCANSGPTLRGDGSKGNDTLVKMSALLDPPTPAAYLNRAPVPYTPRCTEMDVDVASDEE